MRNKKGKKKVGTKTADKSEQRNAASGLIPLSLRERGRRRAKLGDPAWFNSRREDGLRRSIRSRQVAFFSRSIS